jgi:2-methylisocitrate lyase-like PEP mutase family enzyme
MHPGNALRETLRKKDVIEPFIGIFDSFSAILAAKHSPNLFYSGFGFAASYYGAPDNGYIAWSDMVQAAWRVRQALPNHTLLVDIDDGYVDVHTACRVVSQLEGMGIAMVMLEDQARPRRCGHTDGKILLPLANYLEKLNTILEQRGPICVMARTDASGEEIFRRVEALSKTAADVLLVDAVASLETLYKIRNATDKPMAFNQMAGGKSPRLSLLELREAGVDIIQYSTPLLFAAQKAMDAALVDLFADDGRLPDMSLGKSVGVRECTSLLESTLARRLSHAPPDPATNTQQLRRKIG